MQAIFHVTGTGSKIQSNGILDCNFKANYDDGGRVRLNGINVKDATRTVISGIWGKDCVNTVLITGSINLHIWNIKYTDRLLNVQDFYNCAVDWRGAVNATGGRFYAISSQEVTDLNLGGNQNIYIKDIQSGGVDEAIIEINNSINVEIHSVYGLGTAVSIFNYIQDPQKNRDITLRDIRGADYDFPGLVSTTTIF
jgi:hypothetical protein